MADEVKVKITDPQHLMDMGEWYGYALAISKLKGLPAAEKSAGFGLALATLQTMEANKRAENAGHNIRLIVRAGHDLDAYHVAWKGGDEIVLEPIESSPKSESDEHG